MSKDFISFRYTPNEDFQCLELWGLDIVGNEVEVLKEYPLPKDPKYYRGILIPDFKGDDYVNSMIECTINLLTALTHSMDLTPKSGVEFDVTVKDKPIKLSIIVKELAAILQHIMNSTSWNNGKEYPYDISEIKRRLKLLGG